MHVTRNMTFKDDHIAMKSITIETNVNESIRLLEELKSGEKGSVLKALTFYLEEQLKYNV
jgi:hypothetical protein